MTGRLPPVVELRKESQQSLSPDQLASSIKVSKPSGWVLMGAIAVLLVAGVAWFFAGTITVSAFGIAAVPGDAKDADAAAASAATATVYLPLSGASGVKPGDAVTLTRAGELPGESDASFSAKLVGTVLAVSETPVSVSEVCVRCAGADFSVFAEDGWAVAVSVELGAPAAGAPAAPAAYNASIATAQHRPIRLLLGLE